MVKTNKMVYVYSELKKRNNQINTQANKKQKKRIQKQNGNKLSE